MYESKSKNTIMIILIFLMACYFIGINFLDEINKKNENNSYVSLNIVSTTKEDYIEEYITYIKDGKYNLAYNMQSNESKSKLTNSVDKFKSYSEKKYKNIDKEEWNFRYIILSEESLKKMNVYEYKVQDKEDDETIINRLKLNEYASNVYKIDID